MILCMPELLENTNKTDIIDELHLLTKVDRWFLNGLKNIATKKSSLAHRSPPFMLKCVRVSLHLAGTPAQFFIMQRTLRLTWLLSAILLACAGGCGTDVRISDGDEYFEVDGVGYRMVWSAHAGRVEGQKSDVSCLILYRDNLVRKTLSMIHNRDNVSMTVKPEWGQLIAKTETCYFLQDGKAIFEKSYQELGIDTSRLNTKNKDEVLAYLQPILEPLIREHVQPQETETKTDKPHEE